MPGLRAQWKTRRCEQRGRPEESTATARAPLGRICRAAPPGASRAAARLCAMRSSRTPNRTPAALQRGATVQSSHAPVAVPVPRWEVLSNHVACTRDDKRTAHGGRPAPDPPQCKRLGLTVAVPLKPSQRWPVPPHPSLAACVSHCMPARMCAVRAGGPGGELGDDSCLVNERIHLNRAYPFVACKGVGWPAAPSSCAADSPRKESTIAAVGEVPAGRRF